MELFSDYRSEDALNCHTTDKDRRQYLENCLYYDLPVPVRFILDDFATNAEVPNFQEVTSVIRSRGIAVSVILQSLRQLVAIYGPDNALTIANNCDHWIYLGGQDMYTARQVASRADKREQSVLGMKVHQVCVLARGDKARYAESYRLENHPKYAQTPEGAKIKGPGSLLPGEGSWGRGAPEPPEAIPVADKE